MKILELWIIIGIVSVAYSSDPFDYRIFQSNVVPLEVKTINFIPISSYEPIENNFLIKDTLPPRIPAEEYGPPKEKETLFKPSSTTTTTTTTTTEAEIKLQTTTPKVIQSTTPKVFLPPGLPELPEAPKVPLTTTTTTTTESSFISTSTEELKKPAEEYGPPKFAETSFEKTTETPLLTTSTTPKVVLEPGLPELPPAPMFSEEKIQKPADEYGLPPKENNKFNYEYTVHTNKESFVHNKFQDSRVTSINPSKLPEGLPTLPSDSKIPLTTLQFIPGIRAPSISTIINLPELPSAPVFPKPIFPELPTIFLPTGIPELPAAPTISLPLPSITVSLSPGIPGLPTATLVPGKEKPLTTFPSVVEPLTESSETLELPTTTSAPEFSEISISTIEKKVSSGLKVPTGPYPAAEPVKEMHTTTTEIKSPPTIIFQKIHHYVPPTVKFGGAPYPPPLPYSNYGDR